MASPRAGPVSGSVSQPQQTLGISTPPPAPKAAPAPLPDTDACAMDQPRSRTMTVSSRTPAPHVSRQDILTKQSLFAPYWHPSPPFDTYEAVKTAVLAVTLLPLRLLLFLFVLMTYSVIGLLCTINVPLDQPLSPFRRRMLCCSGMMCARLGLFILGFYYIPIRGRRDPRFHTIVSNHGSFLDILFFVAVCFPAFVSKAGVLKVPFVGRLSRTFQCLYVSKHVDPKAPSATAAIMERQKMMADPSSRYHTLLVFAEGTTTNCQFMAPFRTGAFRSGQPVQPAVLKFEGKHFIPTWESLPLKWYLFRLLTQVYHSASVTFLPGYTPSPEEQQNPVLYADNVRSLMSQHSGIPMATANHHFKWALHKQMLAKTKPLKWQWHRNETVQDPRTFATASWEVETKPSISAPSDIESVPTVLAASTVPCCAEAMQPRAQGDDAGRLAPPLPVVSATSTDDESTASPEEVGVAVNVPAAAAAHHPNGTPIVPPEPVVAAADADPTRAAEARDVRQVEGSNSLGAEPTETVRHTVDVASHVPV